MNMRKNNISRILVTGLFALVAIALFAPQASAFPLSHYTQSSKLSQGKWVKIKITDSGIYQITDADARNWGFSGGVASLHVFGRGGAPISETLTTDIPDDLPQVPVVRTNGKLLFYAQGNLTWAYASKEVSSLQQQHPYSTETFYFVTDSNEYEDIAINRNSNPIAGTPVTTFVERLFHEKELVNPGQIGRDFLGEDFISNPSQNFSFNLKGLVSGTDVVVLTEAGVRQSSTTGSGNFSFQYNGTNLPVTASDKFAYDNSPHLFYTVKTMQKSFSLNKETLNYNIKYTNNNATVTLARLNYITVNYQRQLALDNGRLYFVSAQNHDTSTPLAISNAGEGVRVWDVTKPHLPVELNTATNGTTTVFAPAQSGRREYAAFSVNASYASPQLVGQVANQDIHALPVPDMIIITHPQYMTQALRVAELHENLDSMRVLTLSQDEIFNEFSSGVPDMMAYRLLCKYFYDRGTDKDGHHLQYALLMGNGTFDNKHITNEFKAIAFPALLTWQSQRSSIESSSYCTDAAIASLQDDSGNSWGTNIQDIGVGRFAVKSEEEARIAVDKLIKYVTSPLYGSWRNNVIILADDEESGQFMEQSEGYIQSANKNTGTNYMFKRIYLDAYESESLGGSRNYPGARDDFYGGLRDGVLLWGYNGHSSPNVVSDHNLIRNSDYLNNMFYKHLPLAVATTCELARYDAIEESGGELMFLNKNGGAIAVLSSNRQAGITSNAILGNKIYENIFARDNDGLPMRLGDVFRNACNQTRLGNNQAYFLMGDPAMRLAMPKYTARIDAINGTPINPDNKPEFKARQTVTFTGTIVDHKGDKVNNFNGTVSSQLYDCDQSITTHGYGSGGVEFTYQEHSNRIAVGSDSVKNGQFSVKITIPSEISYDNYTPSLINLYAYDAEHHNDANGSSEDFIIYGYDESAKADTIGPSIIYLGLNGENFKNGEDVNENPIVFASITDDSGINLSDAGIGHSITLTLDDDIVYTNVNKFYSPVHSTQGYKGSLSYQLKDLDNGAHTLRLRVWDVFNNMSEKTISFNVVKGLKPDIYEVYATHNPASVETTFYVKHNRPDATLNVGISVYDLMGRLVWTTQQSGQSDLDTSFPITWNLTDLGGNRVPRGIYVYRATVSTDGVREATKSKKLAVVGQ